ncbi:MAG: phosphohistidine phosphatase SixA [Planctomycetes bacterium]|nr:phosphohistidine phosphatase SixA [Planctomycetota bacterium]
MFIYLLRHGIAEDAGPRTSDDQRALTPEGMQRLQAAAPAWRRAIARLDAIHCSPLQRARQTATVLAEATGFAMPPAIDPALIPSAEPLVAFELIQAAMHDNLDGIALVGHEPHLGYLLGMLLTGSERGCVPFKKGMLVGVEMESKTSLVGQIVFALSQRVAGRLA